MKKTRIWSAKIIWIILIISIITNIVNTRKIRPDKVFIWDIKSYYAYLPATIIHGDVHLDFLKEYDAHYNDYFWPSKLENGNKLIITSMGLSMLYAPFFMTAHIFASISSYDANGYSYPYAYALIYSILFYVMLGFIMLRKILLRYFDDFTTTLTLIVVYFGTNLFYYSLYIPMTHAYNFALYAAFILYTIKWHKNSKLKSSIILGVLYGLLSLVRPTNALIVFLFILYDIKSFKDLADKVLFFLRKWKYVLIIAAMTFVIWIPQMLYWKEITGHYIYYSYGIKKASFFWDNPQLFNALFSFRKGWLVYTPVMVFALAGIWFLIKKPKEFLVPILIIVPLYIYVQSSWWSWWFGGGYGNRAFVDFYGLLAIPLAAFIQNTKNKNHFWRYSIIGIMSFVILLNSWNIVRYNHVSIHYYWNSSASYLENIFHVKPSGRYWRTIPYPDYDKARKGVYVAENLIERYEGEYNISPEMILSQIKATLSADDVEVKKLEQKHAISVDSAKDIVARNIYEQNYSLNQYIRPIEQKFAEEFTQKYGAYLNTLEQKHGLKAGDISVEINFPQERSFVYADNEYTNELLSKFYTANMIDTSQNGKLYEIKGVKEYWTITDDMENKKKKLQPTTFTQKYSIVLPERIFENCFTGNWAVNVGNALDKSIRITIPDINKDHVLISFWKKGTDELVVKGNNIANNEIVTYSNILKGHWIKQEIMVKLKKNSTQPLQLVIQSMSHAGFIADDLAIYILKD
ncbi:MAG: hypothetical protein C0599_11420 [Salinivirgaceae bacterium]|nr:MAG: hypothetical protein C0599_11420 [Salinivirgaceae bacterium]